MKAVWGPACEFGRERDIDDAGIAGVVDVGGSVGGAGAGAGVSEVEVGRTLGEDRGSSDGAAGGEREGDGGDGAGAADVDAAEVEGGLVGRGRLRGRGAGSQAGGEQRQRQQAMQRKGHLTVGGTMATRRRTGNHHGDLKYMERADGMGHATERATRAEFLIYGLTGCPRDCL